MMKNCPPRPAKQPPKTCICRCNVVMWYIFELLKAHSTIFVPAVELHVSESVTPMLCWYQGNTDKGKDGALHVKT
jgi:hypothetical protein